MIFNQLCQRIIKYLRIWSATILHDALSKNILCRIPADWHVKFDEWETYLKIFLSVCFNCLTRWLTMLAEND